MTDVKVKDYPGLVKRDRGYIVSTDDDGYQLALSRRRSAAKSKDMDRRLNVLEDQLSTIIELLRGTHGNKPPQISD